MSKRSPGVSSGHGMARAVSIVGLVLVWGVVWANLPSREEMSSGLSKSALAVPLVEPELDLSIPGVHAVSIDPPEPTRGAVSTQRVGGPARASSPAESPDPDGVRARQVAEVKCEAEVQRFCPESLAGEVRWQCVEARLKQLAPVCEQIVRQRIVRWNHAEGYKLACRDDRKRFCPMVQPGDGRILQCLQDHAQELSDRCHQSLPKGHLLLRQ